MPDLSRGAIEINMANYLDLDKELIHAYLYLYPVKLSSKITTATAIGTRVLNDADKPKLNKLLAETKSTQENVNTIQAINADIKKTAEDYLNQIDKTLKETDYSGYKSSIVETLEAVRSLIADVDGNDLRAFLSVVRYMKDKYDSDYNTKTLNQKLTGIQSLISKFYVNYMQKSSTFVAKGTYSAVSQYMLVNAHREQINSLVTSLNNTIKTLTFTSAISQRIIRSFASAFSSYANADISKIDTFFNIILSFYQDTFSNSLSQAPDILTIISVFNPYYDWYLRALGNYVDADNNLTNTGVLSGIDTQMKNGYKTTFKSLTFKTANIKTDLQPYVNSLNGDQDFNNIIDYINSTLVAQVNTQKSEDNSKEKTIKKQFTNFYFVFPILDTKLEQKYSFSWEEFEYGQMNPGDYIKGTLGKSALKLGGEITKEALNSMPLASNMAKSGVKIGEKVMSEIESLAGNENLRNAIQQQAGQAFIRPKKKIFKGTGYLTHTYKIEGMTPKSQKAHLEILRILKLMKALITPTQASGDIVTAFTDVLASGFLGQAAAAIPAGFRKDIPKMNDVARVMTDLYLYTMSYPMTFRGVVKTKGNPELTINPLTVKFFPEAGITEFATSVDLTMAFYEETNLPATVGFDMTLEELVPFHAGISLFSPESTSNSIPDALDKLNSGTLNDKLSVYEKTFSIL